MIKKRGEAEKSSARSTSVDDDLDGHSGVGLENLRDVFHPPLPADNIEDVYDWYCACEEVDTTEAKNKTALIDLVQSDRSLPFTARACIADLLTRYRFIVRTQLTGLLGGVVEAEEENTTDTQAIMEQLISEEPFSLITRRALADLLSGYEMKRYKGKQPTPFYRWSNKEWLLELARYEVRRVRRSGKSVEDAVHLVAREGGLDVDVLRNAHAKRRGATTQMRERVARLRTRIIQRRKTTPSP